MDQVDGCVLATSRRGTYIRQARHRRDPDRSLPIDEDSHRGLDTTGICEGGKADVADGTSLHTDRVERPTQQQSLSSMFESYVEQNEHDRDGAVAQLGVMLLGEHSPLTFALKESDRTQPTSLHDVAVNISKSKLSVKQARGRHPPHISPQDLDYLSARGVFAPPVAGLEELFVSTFLERFYPLYSIVDKEEIWHLHQKSALPYILLHAICMIGATFCDISAIHKYGFESRMHARKSFYDKAKVLFDFEYEKDRFVLLQTVIMLSFWGPHMDSPWNPCSWIGFGVTIAASLGMHKARSTSHVTGKDRGLIKRIWWNLLARDAYCAALMGRPARVDMSQCDTPMLTPVDFPEEVQTQGHQPLHVLYQIAAAQLSMVVRQIIAKCPMAEKHTIRPHDLHDMLHQWQAELPTAIAFDPGMTKHSNIFATSLKILYHYHILSIHLKWPGLETSPPHDPNLLAAGIPSASVSAHVLSSMGSTLVTKRIISQLPTEVFTGFFMAGIVFYRQLRQANPLVSELARASLNNCQLLLHEVREIFDPTRWVIRIFDFLLSNTADGDASNHAKSPLGDESQDITGMGGVDSSIDLGTIEESFNMPDDTCDLFSMNWDNWNQAPEDDVLGTYNGTWLMPDILSTL